MKKTKDKTESGPTFYQTPNGKFLSSVYASTLGRYYPYGGTFDMPRQQMYMPLDHVNANGGPIYPFNPLINTPQSVVYNNQRLNKGITTLPEIPIHPPQHRTGDSDLENVWEILDPSGFSSYNDVYDSYKKTGMSPETMLEVMGALPVIGKFGKMVKGMKLGTDFLKEAKLSKALGVMDKIGKVSSANDVISPPSIELIKASKIEAKSKGGYLAPILPMHFDKGTQIYRDTTEIPNYRQGGKLMDFPAPSLSERETNINYNVYASMPGRYYNNGGMIKRADGSYSQRGLWDNIRANKGSGKEPTKEMLAQERKIKSNQYGLGGHKAVFFATNVSEPGADDKDLTYPKDAYVYNNGGYVNPIKNSNLVNNFNSGGNMNFKSNAAYKAWLGYGHATGVFERTPGNQSVSIKGKSKDVEHDLGGYLMANGGSININPANKGKFTASANAAGMGVQEFANHVLANKEDYSTTQIRRANFAHNAAGWHHAMGGMLANGGGITPVGYPFNNPTFKAFGFAEGGLMGEEPIGPPKQYTPIDYAKPSEDYIKNYKNNLEMYNNNPKNAKGIPMHGGNYIPISDEVRQSRIKELQSLPAHQLHDDLIAEYHTLKNNKPFFTAGPVEEGGHYGQYIAPPVDFNKIQIPTKPVAPVTAPVNAPNQQFYYTHPYTGEPVYDINPVTNEKVYRKAPEGSLHNIQYAQYVDMAQNNPQNLKKIANQKAEIEANKAFLANPTQKAEWEKYKANNPTDSITKFRSMYSPNIAASNTVMMPEGFAFGGSFNNKGFMSLPKEVQAKIKSNSFAEGGPITEFNEGGTHEENIMGGIPQGMGANGQPNLVEQGETKLDAENYIFSDRLKVTKDVAEDFNFPKNFVGKTFADVSKLMDRPNSRRENDTIEETAKKRDLQNLMDAQESFKEREVAKKMEEIKSLDPTALQGMGQPQGMGQEMAPEMQGQIPQSVAPMGMPQGMPIDASQIPPEMLAQMPEAQQGAPVMACGGHMYRCGGKMYDFGGTMRDIGAGAYGAGEGLLDTLTMGATDSITDAGYKALQRAGKSNADEIAQQNMIRGYGNVAGAVTGAILDPASLGSAVSEGSEGLSAGITNTPGTNEKTDKIVNTLGQVGSIAGGFVGGGEGTGALTGNKNVEALHGLGNNKMMSMGMDMGSNLFTGLSQDPNALTEEQKKAINKSYINSSPQAGGMYTSPNYAMGGSMYPGSEALGNVFLGGGPFEEEFTFDTNPSYRTNALKTPSLAELSEPNYYVQSLLPEQIREDVPEPTQTTTQTNIEIPEEVMTMYNKSPEEIALMSNEEKTALLSQYDSDLKKFNSKQDEKNVDLNFKQTPVQAAMQAAPALYNIGVGTGLWGKPEYYKASDYTTAADIKPYEYNIDPQVKEAQKTYAQYNNYLRNMGLDAGALSTNLGAAANGRNEALGRLYTEKLNADAQNAYAAKMANKQIEQSNKAIGLNVDSMNRALKAAKLNYLQTGLGQVADIGRNNQLTDLQLKHLGVLSPDYAGEAKYTSGWQSMFDAMKNRRNNSEEKNS